MPHGHQRRDRERSAESLNSDDRAATDTRSWFTSDRLIGPHRHLGAAPSPGSPSGPDPTALSGVTHPDFGIVREMHADRIESAETLHRSWVTGVGCAGCPGGGRVRCTAPFEPRLHRL